MHVRLAQDVSDVQTILGFYRFHSDTQVPVKYPRDYAWVSTHQNSFLLFGAWNDEEVVGAAWLSYRPEWVYFVEEREHLVLRREVGFHAEVGGMIVHPDFTGQHVNTILCAAWWAHSTAWRTGREEYDTPLSIHTRIPGIQSDTQAGIPRFWELAGEEYTRLSYKEVLDFPLSEQDAVIYQYWRKGISGLPVAVPLTEEIRLLIGGAATRQTRAFQRNYRPYGLEWDEVTLSPNSLARYYTCTNPRMPKAFAARMRVSIEET